MNEQLAFDITIKNYRCFSLNKPAHIVVRDGFTAFVGINNSGKSALLKFFYEFRNMFALVQPNVGNVLSTLQGNQDFSQATTIRDINE